MDDLTDYKKGHDLIFQEIDEKRMLQEQTIREEFARRFFAKLKAANVTTAVISNMIDAGKSGQEIKAFLDEQIFENFVKLCMAGAVSGKPISREQACEQVRRSLEWDENQPSK